MRSEFSLARFSTAAMVSLCVVTSCSRVLPATEPRPAKGKSDLSGPVKRLVNDLGSNRRAIRESARRRLLALGPAILKHLPAPNTVKNVATRVAIRRLIRTLERTTATRSARASQVTISGRPTLETLVASISKQTGNRLTMHRLSPKQRQRPVPIKLIRSTYWQAIDSVMSRAKLDLVHRNGATTLIARDNRKTDRSIALSGPFRVTATTATPKPIPDSDRQLLPVRLSWMAEPRLRPLYLVCRPANFRATGRFDDDRTKSLDPRSPEATLELPLEGSDPDLQLRIDFQTPGDQIPREIQLAGTADVWLAAGSQEFVFQGPVAAKPVVHRRAGIAVVLTSIRHTPANGDRFDATFGITVQYESGGPAFESHRLWMLYNRAHLVPTSSSDKKPVRQVAYDRFETLRLGDGTAELAYHFKNLKGQPRDWRFVYQAPTQIIKIPVPLEFARWKVPTRRSKD